MIEYTDEQHDSLIRGHRKQLADAQATVEALRAQLTALRELVGQWAWNTTNLLGDYRIATVADFNAEWTRRSIWLIEAVQATLPPPQAEQDQQTMYELRQQVEALQAQLPAEMQDCTILFKECEKGHGKLVATNWRDHGCQTCEVEALQREHTQLQALVRELPVLHAPIVVCLNGNWTVKSTDSPLKYSYIFESQQTAVAVCKLLRYRATLDATTPAPKGGNGE